MPSYRPAQPLLRLVLLVCLTVLLAACANPASRAPRQPAKSSPSAATTAEPDYLLLVSIDGFRADYLDRGVTPRLAMLAAGGVRAEALRPAFPDQHRQLSTLGGLLDSQPPDPARLVEFHDSEGNQAILVQYEPARRREMGL